MITQIEMQFMEAVKGLHRLLKESAGRGIDWEQRRYEIAKEIYPVIVSKCTAKELPEAAITAVFLANLLVLELKKMEDIENEKKNKDRG